MDNTSAPDPAELTRIGKDVRDARLRRGWSKEEAARRAGISSITWKRVEDGDPVRDLSLRAILAVVGLEDPAEAPAESTDLAVLIANDPTLSEAARAHFLAQYLFLQQASAVDVSGESDEQRILDSDLPEGEKKRMIAQLRRNRPRHAERKDHGKAL